MSAYRSAARPAHRHRRGMPAAAGQRGSRSGRRGGRRPFSGLCVPGRRLMGGLALIGRPCGRIRRSRASWSVCCCGGHGCTGPVHAAIDALWPAPRRALQPTDEPQRRRAESCDISSRVRSRFPCSPTSLRSQAPPSKGHHARLIRSPAERAGAGVAAAAALDKSRALLLIGASYAGDRDCLTATRSRPETAGLAK